MPEVSIYMPCYNHEEYVGEAIQSVLDQTYTDFEFIIVDNGCTDNSYEVMKRFDDPRITIIRLERNNPLLAFQTALKTMTGRYYAGFFSDDKWEKQKLEKQMKYLKEHPEVKCSATWAVFTDENMNTLEWSKGLFWHKQKERLEYIRFLLEKGNFLSACSLVVELDLFVKAADYTLGTWNLSDYYQWFYILMESNIGMVEECLVKQRFHSSKKTENISYPSVEQSINAARERVMIASNIIEKLNDEDFLNMYRDMLLRPDASTHLEVICEKFFILLKYAKLHWMFEQVVLDYFYKYYPYSENGKKVAEVFEEKYGYSHAGLREEMNKMGYIWGIEKKNLEIAKLEKKIRVLIPEKEKRLIVDSVQKIEAFIQTIREDKYDSETFVEMTSLFKSLLDSWKIYSYMDIEIKKEEIELMVQLSNIYSGNTSIVEKKEVILQLQSIKERISVFTSLLQ